MVTKKWSKTYEQKKEKKPIKKLNKVNKIGITEVSYLPGDIA